jgi:hypothetical protein
LLEDRGISVSGDFAVLLVRAVRNNQPPLNPTLSWPVLMVVLWREYVILRDSYFMPASIATIDAGP